MGFFDGSRMNKLLGRDERSRPPQRPPHGRPQRRTSQRGRSHRQDDVLLIGPIGELTISLDKTSRNAISVTLVKYPSSEKVFLKVNDMVWGNGLQGCLVEASDVSLSLIHI